MTILNIKKVPTLTTKLNQEKKLSIGTRRVISFYFWIAPSKPPPKTDKNAKGGLGYGVIQL
jgi:hypothetical protein